MYMYCKSACHMKHHSTTHTNDVLKVVAFHNVCAMVSASRKQFCAFTFLLLFITKCGFHKYFVTYNIQVKYHSPYFIFSIQYSINWCVLLMEV